MHFSTQFVAASLFAANTILAADGPVNCEKQNAGVTDLHHPIKPSCRDFQTGLVWTSENELSSYCRPDALNDKVGKTLDGGLANALWISLDGAFNTWHAFTFDEQGNQRTETLLRGPDNGSAGTHQWQFFPTNIKTRIYVQIDEGKFTKWTDIHGNVRDVSECEHVNISNQDTERWYCVFWRDGDGDMPCNP